MSRLTRSLAAVPLAAALSLSLSAPVGASDGPDTIALERGSLPEGITTGPDQTFFAGARSDGAVRQYDARTGRLLETVVAGRQGEVAVGILYDGATNRLFVSGGNTGDITVYDADLGTVLAAANVGTERFINDVTLTTAGAYFTDSTGPRLFFLPYSGSGFGAVQTVPLTGEYVQPSGFGANGIRTLPTGELILVSGGVLYTVTPDGVATVVKQKGQALSGGDGLVLDGRTLYVVYGRNGTDSVVQLELDKKFRSTRFVRELDEDDTTSDLDRPTTGALVNGDLYVVNGRFPAVMASGNNGRDLEFSVSRLDL